MLETPAHTYEHRREKEEGVALMEACAEGGAAAEGAAFESWLAGATQFKLRLPPFPSCPHCAAHHPTTAHPPDAQWLIC